LWHGRLVSQNVQQVPNFVIDKAGVGNELGDLRAKDLPVSPAQSVNGYLQRSFGYTESPRYFSIGNVTFVSGQELC
jgi:hypothetical protein